MAEIDDLFGTELAPAQLSVETPRGIRVVVRDLAAEVMLDALRILHER